MNKLISILFSFLFLFSGILISQTDNRSGSNDQNLTTIIQPSLIKGSEGLIGAQCVGGIVYDDNTWENGFGWNAGYGIGKFAMKLTPPIYPFTINQICLALTRTSAGSANWTLDVIVYDATGSGGGPGNVVATFANQIAVNVPIWPTVSWFDFTGLSGIPQLTSGQSYYVGLSYDPATMPSHYIASDESGTTIQRQCYGYISGSWAPLSGSVKAIGVRADGFGIIYTHNIATGPFLSLPMTFNQNQQKIIKAKVSNIGTSNESGIPMKFFINGILLNTVTINLNAGAIDSVSYYWTPTDTGNFTLKIVSALANDEFRANDTAVTTVHVYPPGLFQTCYGSGTIAVGYPFYTFYMDSRTDMLYLAGEIGTGASTFTKIGFNVTAAAPQVMNGFKIKMLNTTATTISAFGTGMTEVFSANYTVPGIGWRWITLNTPFTYTGGNLLIEICFNNSSWTANSNVASTTVTGRCFHSHMDLTSGDGCTGITTGTLQTTLPNICFQGAFSGIQNPPNEIPKVFSLEQNYPNPFNPVTSIKYSIPKQSNVKLTVYDVTGKEVIVLADGIKKAGYYEERFDASDIASGIYFYKLQTDEFSSTKKMSVLK